MPPVDSTPDVKPGNFELIYSLKAYNRIPVHEYRSKETGLTLVIAEVEGPVVNGFFCLVTEAFDDDGLPHTLEHLIFLGSETYPYKGVLDLLANRCLASGTNAWTDIDHTCYTMETAGSEGFLSLMPIFLDHILYPILSDEGFVTEVHHITGEGEDAGVVYCEMQGRENSAESRLHLTMARKMYPGHCGYSSETGGIMKNLRETCNNTKVKSYHKEFYRPENLKIIITGQVKPEDVFKALEPVEMKIRSKGDRGPFTRPWQNPCPPVESSENVLIKYPSDDEKNGIFSAAWRGPSAVKDQYTLMSCSILLKYLTDFAVSPLQREFVEVNDPYASKDTLLLSQLRMRDKNVRTVTVDVLVLSELVEHNISNKLSLNSLLMAYWPIPLDRIPFGMAQVSPKINRKSEKYSDSVVYSLSENSESCLYFIFENVPKAKLCLIKPKLDEILANIVENEDIDMERMKNIINRAKLESLSNMENNPHHAIAFMIIGHMLYGNTKEDLEQRINPLVDLDKMTKESKSYWLKLLEKYFVKNNCVTIEGHPSIEEQQHMAAEEKERIEKQIQTLSEEGLQQKATELVNAIEYNERPPPDSMLTSVNIPSLSSIGYHNITRYRSDMINQKLDLSEAPVFTYFDHVKSGFIYMFALLDTSQLKCDQKLYLPLLLDSIFELPINKDGEIIPYEEVVTQLNTDTVSTSQSIGLGTGSSCRFKCGSYCCTANVMLQVETAKYEEGVCWLRNLLYNTVFTIDRLKIIAQKVINDVAQAKRSGRDVVSYVMKGLCYASDTNQSCNGILRQQKFLTNLLDKLETEQSCEVLDEMYRVRSIITDPSNVVLYFAGGLDQLQSPEVAIKNFLPPEMDDKKQQEPLNVIPDWKLLCPLEKTKPSCIIGMGCLESSFFYQITPSITSFTDPDVPALMLYSQYLIQAEGPMWKQIRGKGLSYGYTISLKINEGLLCLIFLKATNVVGAYKEAHDIISTQLKERKWDNTLLEAAKSSLIFELIEEEKTIGNVVSLSLSSYFQQVDYKYNRTLLGLIEKVTVDDLNRVGEKYIASMFDSSKTKTAVVCDPSKADEIKTGFKKLGLELQVYPSLEDSFLNF